MSNAAERLAAVDALPAVELCTLALGTLQKLVVVMNEETTLLRSGKARVSTEVTAEKTRLAQDYMGLARAVQRQAPRLKQEAPQLAENLLVGHERLALQMAENLKVIATARAVTEDLLTDFASTVAARAKPKTYGADGTIGGGGAPLASGVSVNRAL
jgi:flagellar biosynthesis/type III secretory pathway chaperone